MCLYIQICHFMLYLQWQARDGICQHRSFSWFGFRNEIITENSTVILSGLLAFYVVSFNRFDPESVIAFWCEFPSIEMGVELPYKVASGSLSMLASVASAIRRVLFANITLRVCKETSICKVMACFHLYYDWFVSVNTTSLNLLTFLSWDCIFH